jgi:prefoldin subunit 5
VPEAPAIVENKEKTEEENALQKIIINKELFEQIKKSLIDTVASMEKDPSLFSRVAKFWGAIPLWQKILVGIALIVPALILGIVMHLNILLVLCAVTSVLYVGGGLILDDHHNKCGPNMVKNLEKGILSLANLLELTINALDSIREQLQEEITKFSEENNQLKENVTFLAQELNTLTQQIDAMDKHITAASNLTQFLSTTKEGLDGTSELLKENVAEHTNLLAQNQEKLARVTDAYTLSQNQLVQRIGEVSAVKQQLQDEVERLSGVIGTLKKAVLEITESSLSAKTQALLKEKVEQFVEDKEASFTQILARLSKTEEQFSEQFSVLQQALQNTNSDHKELLKVHQEQMNRFEKVIHEKESKAPVIALALDKNGLYALKRNSSPMPSRSLGTDSGSLNMDAGKTGINELTSLKGRNFV